MVFPAVFIPLALAYKRYVEKHLGIDMNPINWTTLKYSWPFAVVSLAYFIFVVRSIRITLRRGLR